MINSIFLSLAQYRIFWRLRRIVSSTLFSLWSSTFSIKSGLRKANDNTSILLSLFRATWQRIFSAIIFAIILYVIDPYFYELHKKLNLESIHAEDYVTFLATISGIGGVFIGLYYAAISMVGSSIYAKTPSNIKNLLTQDIHGNVYMGFLSFLTFLGLVLIAMRVGGIVPIYSAVPIMTLLSGVGIISFVKLGQRAFQLSDPTILSSHPFRQLWRWAETVKAGKFRWLDKNFQHHAYKQAHQSLNTLHTLSNITSSDINLRSEPFLNLCKNLIEFLIDYENTKIKIPSNSMWYEQKHEHTDWYKATDLQTSIAHHTGTALQPKTINNKEWVEDRVIPILKNYLLINLQTERYADVIGFADYIRTYLSVLAKNGKVERALGILEDLGETVLDVIASESQEELVADVVLEKLAIIGMFSIMPTAIALEFCKYVEKLDTGEISKKLSKINWNKDDQLYQYGFPSHFLPRLESLKSKLNFEISAEGYLISPIWYQKELLLQVEADIFVENTNSLISKSTDLYKSWIKKTTDNKHPWLTSAVMSNEWEFWHKIDHQLDLWKTKWDNMSENRKINELPWAKFEYEKLDAAAQERQKELIQLMSMQNIKLVISKKPENFPDYAGQFLHIAGEKSFDALIEKNENLLRNIFTPYFCGCMVRFESLTPESIQTDWDSQQNVKIAIEPLLDLINISGYAKLMADYHGNVKLWEIVVDVWDKYFEINASRLPLFAGTISFSAAPLSVSHRSILRTNWQLKIKDRLADVPRREADVPGYANRYAVIQHDSALIRTFARNPYTPFYDGMDIFVVYYFANKEGAKGLDFGQKWQRLKRTLDREGNNSRTHDDSEDPR